MIDKALEAEILRLHSVEKWKVGTIASQLNVHHETVERVLAQGGLAPERSSNNPTMIQPYMQFVVAKLEQYPRLCASRLYHMAKERGYPGGQDHFRHLVARVRPRPPQEAYLRLRTLIGEQAQVDWGAFGKITIGKAIRALWAFVMVLSWSRQIFLRFYLSAAMPNFVRGHTDAFAFFRGIPRVLLYDNLKSAVLERTPHAIHFNPRLVELARYYRFEPRPVAVRRGNEKGRVERAIRYIRGSFFAGRTFRDVEDLNRQADVWITGISGDRSLPEDRTKLVRDAFAEEQPKLLPLPDEPFPSEEISRVEVGKTPYVRFDLNDYSVPHAHVRRSLTVAASLQVVRILDGANTIATHPRCWDRDQQIEDPSHTEALVEYKRKARRHRGLDRLSSAAPSATRLLNMAAERGFNLGSMTARLLVLLDQVSPAELELAIQDAIAADLPTVGAVRQSLDRRLIAKGLPPPVSLRFAGNQRVANATVKPHSLSTYDQLNRNHDNEEDQ
jgi:transposase